MCNAYVLKVSVPHKHKFFFFFPLPLHNGKKFIAVLML